MIKMEKEAYDPSDITFQSLKSHHPYKSDINHAALLILDMQDIFLNSDSHAYIPASTYIMENILGLIDLFQKHNRPIIFTKHISGKNPNSVMNRWWKNSIEENLIHPVFQPYINHDSLLEKSHYDAFYNTNLQKKLKGVKQIWITGVMTHLCCETTARAAFVRDFEVVFPIDATATYTKELHIGSLRALSHGFGVCDFTNNLIKESEVGI